MHKLITICLFALLTATTACDFNGGAETTEQACKVDSDCNDNLGCTEQYCSDETYTCVKIDTCEGDLTCTPGGCVSMDGPDGGNEDVCVGNGDDGLSCTTDVCVGGKWEHNSTCASGSTCTESGCVVPTCSGSGDDGLSCTTDVCVGTTWQHNSTCSSGQTCTATGCVTPPTIHEINCVDLGAASGKTRITIKGDVYGALVGTLPGTPTYVSLAADSGPGPSWLSVPNPDANYRFSIDATTHLVTTTVDALETVQGFNFYVTNAPVAGGGGDVKWFKLVDYTVTGNCYKNAGGDKVHITP
jgi:hypothetical protein